MRFSKVSVLLVAFTLTSLANAATSPIQKFIRVTTDYHPKNVYRIDLSLDADGNAPAVSYETVVSGKIQETQLFTIAELEGNGQVLLRDKTKEAIRLVLDSGYNSATGGTGHIVYIQGCNFIGLFCKYLNFDIIVDRQGTDFVARNPQSGVFNHLFLKLETDGGNGVGEIDVSNSPIND